MLFGFSFLMSWGQGEVDSQEKILYQNEKSGAILFNTNGYGINLRFGKRKTYLSKTLYDFDLVYIKHPKEERIPASSYYTNQKIVYGKTHIFIDIRPAFGFQRELFSKEDKGSIAVKYYYTFGLSLGITKPIYYNVAIFDANGFLIDMQVEKFENSQHIFSSNIEGRASFWKGFDELSVYPGLNAKFGISFEYSTYNEFIHALEVGIGFDAFLKKIPIMYTEYNNQFFLTLFISYRFGKIVDIKYGKKEKITKEGKVQTQ
jgi:hypothetical protein